MKLHVLPCGDVAEAARVAVRHLGERLELRAREDALRHLHTEHLRILGLALSVCASHEAEGAPRIGADLAALELAEHRGELVDVGLLREAEPRPSVHPWIVDYRHRHAPESTVVISPPRVQGRVDPPHAPSRPDPRP